MAKMRNSKYSPEVREQAVRMVLEHRADDPLQWAAIKSIAGKIGGAAQTLDNWIMRHERGGGVRYGLFKAELIHRCGPWKTKQSVELATLQRVAWFYHQRLKRPQPSFLSIH